MSEQPTSRPPAGGARKGPLGLSRTQWIIVGVAFAGALGYILWKRHTAGSAAASSTAATTPTAGANGQGSGLSAGALTSLQDELDSLLGGGAGGGSSGGGGLTGTGGGTSTATGTATTTATAPTSTATTTSGSTSTAAKAKTAGSISNLQATSVGKTTAKISWNPAANASGGYAYQVKQMNGKLVKSGNTSATSVSLSGLTSKYTYNFGVQALPGGAGDNIHFTTS